MNIFLSVPKVTESLYPTFSFLFLFSSSSILVKWKETNQFVIIQCRWMFNCTGIHSSLYTVDCTGVQSSLYTVDCTRVFFVFHSFPHSAWSHTTEGRLNHRDFFSTDRHPYRPPYRSFEPKL